MRKVVAVEGKPFPDGRMIAPGALRPNDKQYTPVTSSFDFAEVLGRASEFHRDEATGEISYNIELHPRVDDVVTFLHQHDGTVSVSPFESDLTERGALLVTSGVIRMIALIPNGLR